MEFISLRNDVKMPVLGYGVFQIPAEETEKCVLEAIRAGYRSIDTAQGYFNEAAVGNALKKSGLPREEFFVTTKLWLSNHGYEKAMAAIERSLERLQSDYVDLMLIHQPFGDYYGAYRAMEEAYKEGKLRAIGVSNFYPDRLIDLCRFTDIPPMVNQVETHVFYQQQEAHKYMEQYDVVHMSWAPFAEGQKNMFTNPVLTRIGERHSKTAAQTALRYLIQRGVALIPKSSHVERMAQNLNIFDFTLNEEEMDAILSLDEGKTLFFSHYEPESVERLIAMSDIDA